jgi:aryl-alcohol dehydrogenase-like predicted oxidoreductase
MEYTRLGGSGLQVSRLCLGCMSFGGGQTGAYDWTLEEDASRPIIRRALEAGVNFFDTANGYSQGRSEEITGRALRDFALRDEVVLATKAYAPWRGAPNTGGLSRKALLQAIDDSLARLGMDYVDLFQIHRWDYGTPIEETMEALHDIVKAGKARYIGASSMYAWQFQKANHIAERHGWTCFVSMQNHLNLLNREEEREMLPLCADMGVGVIPWSPLARGRLARSPGDDSKRAGSDVFAASLYGATEAQDQRVIDAVGAVAAERGVARAHVALAWLLAKSEVTAPIIGTTRIAQLDECIAAVPLRLGAGEIARLEEHYVPHAVVGLFPPKPDIPVTVTVRD